MCSRLDGRIFLKPLAEMFDSVVCETGEQNVIYFSGLFRDGGNDGRVSVAVKIHPPRRDAINQVAAVVGVEINAFGFRDANWRRVERLLREGMPDS